jgi:hypothetical protein
MWCFSCSRTIHSSDYKELTIQRDDTSAKYMESEIHGLHLCGVVSALKAATDASTRARSKASAHTNNMALEEGNYDFQRAELVRYDTLGFVPRAREPIMISNISWMPPHRTTLRQRNTL